MDDTNLTALKDEYETLVSEIVGGGRAELTGRTRRLLARALVCDASWTESGAERIVTLARKYGSFMLRNALALALALQIEDGDAGF